MLIKKILKKFQQKKQNNLIYGDKESINLSNISIELNRHLKNDKSFYIGKDSFVNINACFESETGEICIGNNVYCGETRIITRSKIQIDDNVMMAWGILIYDHNSHSLDDRERRNDFDVFLKNLKENKNLYDGKKWEVVHTAPIHIKHDAWIGEGVTILSGVTIGEGAIIGAGSVVRESIPAWSIAYGNPCKVVAENKIKPANNN